MVNQQKGVQQETVYNAVDHPCLCFDDPFWVKNDIGTGILVLHMIQLHYRQFLVALLFADLPSLSPFIS